MFKSLIIYLILLNSILNALDTEGIKENNFKIERGFAYSNENYDKNNKKNKEPKEQLDEIIKLLKEQLQVQKDIKEILQNEFNPPHVKIINDKGEECIANLTADCFTMPITAEARRTPVFANWLEKGDLQSAVELKKWMAKYLNTITNRATNYMFAQTEFGSEAYPTDYNTSGFSSVTGYSSILREKVEKSAIEKNLSKVNFLYFIGDNFDADLYSMDNIVKFLKQYGTKIRVQFIFKDEKSYKAYANAGQYNKEFALLNKYKMSIKPEEFKRFNIYNSPTLVAINKEKNTAQKVLVGRASDIRTNKMILMYMKVQGIIKDVDLNLDDGWKNNSDYGHKHIKQLLGPDYLKSLYKNTQQEKK
jgi:uncharacterized FlaG/YvyC family protein